MVFWYYGFRCRKFSWFDLKLERLSILIQARYFILRALWFESLNKDFKLKLRLHFRKNIKISKLKMWIAVSLTAHMISQKCGAWFTSDSNLTQWIEIFAPVNFWLFKSSVVFKRIHSDHSNASRICLLIWQETYLRQQLTRNSCLVKKNTL